MWFSLGCDAVLEDGRRADPALENESVAPPWGRALARVSSRRLLLSNYLSPKLEAAAKGAKRPRPPETSATNNWAEGKAAQRARHAIFDFAKNEARTAGFLLAFVAAPESSMRPASDPFLVTPFSAPAGAASGEKIKKWQHARLATNVNI